MNDARVFVANATVLLSPTSGNESVTPSLQTTSSPTGKEFSSTPSGTLPPEGNTWYSSL